MLNNTHVALNVHYGIENELLRWLQHLQKKKKKERFLTDSVWFLNQGFVDSWLEEGGLRTGRLIIR